MNRVYRFLVAFGLAMALTPTKANAQHLNFGDQWDGTYKNPILMADYSDPDVIRVGKKYYMVASDFHFLGMQVLESDDLVNWKIISQIYRCFDLPGWDDNNHYADGSWAPSIRYHDGKFWVYFCTPEEGLFMSTATDARGPWTPLHCVRQVTKWEDPCPFWDEDGQAYLGHSLYGAGPIILHKMSSDGRQLLDDGDTIYKGPVAEGTKLMKRNGWYYLIIPEGGVGEGWQTCLRSRNIYGPYERKIVLEQGSTQVNGPHQGGLVDTPDDQWWFLHFQLTPVAGRVVHLEPARWVNDWVEMGVDKDGNGVGEPVDVYRKPNGNSSPSLPQTSDDFNQPSLGLQWQWCHNPHDSFWSLSERKGWLTLIAEPSENLKMSHNMLTQKVTGYLSRATVKMDVCKLGNAFAGLLCMGKEFRGLGVSKEGVYLEENGTRRVVVKGKFKTIWLRQDINVERNAFQFSYSTDGKQYRSIGDAFPMKWGNWKGVRTGLYCYGEKGSAQFDYFDYSILK